MNFTDNPQEQGALSTKVKYEAKRRKLRKGTHSCWECKRRKIRCIPAIDGPCQGCRQRGTPCINQEFLEGETSTEMKNPMVRVEALIKQLTEKIANDSDGGLSQHWPSISTPESVNLGNTSECTPTNSGSGSTYQYNSDNYGPVPGSPAILTTTSQTNVRVAAKSSGQDSNWAALSKTLHAAFPSQEDATLLCEASNGIALSTYEANTRSLSELETEGLNTGGSTRKPIGQLPTNTHPVILGRQMLIFAGLIQQFDASRKVIDGLSEPPSTIMKRLADTAINLVCTNEELLGTMEGIECIILEGLFQFSCGNMRRAWLAFRRALMAGQLMGIHRAHGPPLQKVDHNTKINPQFMWFRIVYMDRFFSMMLGLPQGTTDTSMGSETAMAGETPMGRLERAHAVIASRILERKDRDPLVQDITATREIDAELLKAAKSMPPKFWLPPDFSDLEKGTKEEFWEILRLINQLVHYNILNQLHLPFLLRSGPQPDRSKYSKTACVHASREILTRYITYLSLNPFATCFRFFVVPASMTLLLAHLDSHYHQDADNYIAHQRLTDRAMMEKVLEAMEDVENASLGVSPERGENLLQCLLQIEADAAEGQSYSAHLGQGTEKVDNDTNTFRMNIPYFGVIRITRQGVISKEASQPQSISDQDRVGYDTTFGTGSVHASNRFYSLYPPKAGMLPLTQLDLDPTYFPQLGEQRPLDSISQNASAAEQVQSGAHDLAGQIQTLLPCLTAGYEDWAFQGVDNAFLDNLMVGSEGPDGSSVWLPDWQGDNPVGS